MNTVHSFLVRYKISLNVAVTDARFSHNNIHLFLEFIHRSYLCCYSIPRTFRKYWHSMNSHGRWASIFMPLLLFYQTHIICTRIIYKCTHTLMIVKSISRTRIKREIFYDKTDACCWWRRKGFSYTQNTTHVCAKANAYELNLFVGRIYIW